MSIHLRPSQIKFWPLDRLRPYARNARTFANLKAMLLGAAQADRKTSESAAE